MNLLWNDYIDGFEQDCSNSFANTLELLESYAKPSIWPEQIRYV